MNSVELLGTALDRAIEDRTDQLGNLRLQGYLAHKKPPLQPWWLGEDGMQGSLHQLLAAARRREREGGREIIPWYRKYGEKKDGTDSGP